MSRSSGARFSRWWLVLFATVAMGMAGTYQFAWSSIRVPLGARLGTSGTALGTVFTLFIVFQTVSQFPAGWVRDRWGPRLPMAVGALLLVGGYVGTAYAPAIEFVYLAYGLAGVGVGAIYTVAINTPVKWFTDRRGLATGVVGFAYAGVSFVLIPVVRGSIADAFGRTMLGLAAVTGLLTLAAVPFLRDPDADEGAGEEAVGTDGGAAAASATDEGYTWRETVRTWQFWLLYAVFVIINGVGLMVIGKIVSFAEAMSLPAAATIAASMVALGDGAGVVVVGSASDRFGGERTIAASLAVCGVCLAGATMAAGAGLAMAFVALISATAFFRSPAFAVFPTLVGEYYGTSRSSENYAVLYSAKLWGGVVGGTVTSALIVRFGWNATFLVGAVLLVAAGVGTYFLRPVDAGPAGS